MEEERFKAYFDKIGTPFIEDKYDSCPLCKIPFNTATQAREVAEWLNRNIQPYRRFVLREFMSKDGKKIYQLWDNETDTQLPFIPLTKTSNSSIELNAYVDWLNHIVEGKDD